jgi:hypothetical protein
MVDGIQRPRRDQGKSRDGIKAKERPTLAQTARMGHPSRFFGFWCGWDGRRVSGTTLIKLIRLGAVFWFLAGLRSVNNSDQMDQTWRGFLGFGFVELGGLSGEGPSCHGKNLHDYSEELVSYEVL